jgi:hypothetical protein
MAVYTSIDNPELYFQVKLYAGTGSSLALTFDGDEDMQPDLVWLKRRDGSTYSHRWNDSVRGVSKTIYSDINNAENTSDAQVVTSFNSDGFTLGTSAGSNASGVNNVAWCWKESATAGFDIVSYTGNATNRTISHSLSAAPKVVIIKDRSTTGEWVFGHGSLGFTKFIEMNSTGAAQTVTSRFNDTAPTSSVFSVGTANDTNENTDSFIAYLFAEKQGFSKFGSYTGNGNADGTFVYTGFRPAWLMIKGSSNAGDDWILFDTKRDTFNVANKQLGANNSAAENTGASYNYIDLLSNGFKLRGSDGRDNASGYSYIYMAFAEAPFVNSKGVPCNAR